jgi:hypothetical protein
MECDLSRDSSGFEISEVKFGKFCDEGEDRGTSLAQKGQACDGLWRW